MNVNQQRDIGAYIASQVAVTPRVLDAGTTTEDGIEINGADVSLSTSFTGTPRSCKVIIPYSFTGAAAATATIITNCQGGATTASYVDLTGSTGTVTLGTTSSTAAQTVEGVLEVDVTLKGTADFVRVQMTGTLSGTSTGTDDLDVAAVMVFGGFDVLPAA
tara:strand:+ start:25067 stop:25549 length:483 start_codon:yes stop_codon:yes gene_type:complete